MISGRTDQLLRLRKAIGTLLQGGDVPNTIVLSGEAGIGKTTLLDTLVDKLRSSPDPPIVVRALCSTPLAGHDIGEVEALAPWLHIVSQLANEQNENRVHGRSLVGKLALAWVRCIPVVGDVLESAADTALILKGGDRKRAANNTQQNPLRDQEQMFRQCINLLSAISESSSLVVIIDDMHWSDTSSTNLLFSAARELLGRPIIFVVAYRPDEAAVSRGGEGHPIVQIVGELERYSAVEQIRVTPFDADAVVDVLRTRYPDYNPQPKFEGWLQRVSSGNPLFITQFLTTLEEDGRIEQRSGRVAPGYQDVDVPESAQSVILERIRRLEPESRDLLRYASVEGETFSTRLLARVSEGGRLAMLRALRRIEEDHQVITSLGKQNVYGSETTLYRFSHTLVQRALYDSLGEEEREVVHEEMLAVLNEEAERLRGNGEMVRELGPRIAAHAEVLGQYHAAALAVMEGAEASWTEFAVDETLRLVEQAIANVAKARKNEAFSSDLFALESKAYRAMGKILRYRGDYQEALNMVDQSLETARRTGDDEKVVGGQIDRANTLRLLGRLDEAEEEVRRGLELAESSGFAAGHAGALNSLGTILYVVGRKEEAIEVYLQAIDIQKDLGDAFGQAQTYSNLGNAFKALGDRAEAVRCYNRSLEIAAESDNLASYGVALLHLGTHAKEAEEYQGALDFYEQSREIGERIGYRELHAFSLLNIGSVLRITGEFARAEEVLAETATLASSWATKRFMADLSVELGLVSAEKLKETGAADVRTAALAYLNDAMAYYGTLADRTKADEIAAEIEKLNLLKA